MNVAILGYGKMGLEIETILKERNHNIALRSSSESPFKPEDLQGIDMAIEFSQPDAAVDNIFKCFEADCPVVVGTTGWYQRLQEVRGECESRGQSMIYASNFSIGVNVLFHVNKVLAEIMDKLDEYEPGLMEIHHIGKLDKPSGTAITLAEDLLARNTHKTKWVNQLASNPDELTIISQRDGEVPGTHVVNYTSPVDNISIVHQANNRRGFALGAVKAAEWLKDKKGCYSINDFLKF
jgi:4-hydroxy-tetrahydrodipicolinate reductase